MSNLTQHALFRADVVGSFLRPQHLIEAREQFEQGKISPEQLKSVEDEAITDLIAKQKAAGLHVITDGEFRRHSWHLDFMWGLQGVKRVELKHGYFFHGIETYHTSVNVVGTLSGENHPFVEHFKFVKQFEDAHTVAKQTIPAPAQTLAEFYRADNAEQTKSIYPSADKLIDDLAAAYRQVIAELYAAGCRNIQFDDCTWGMVVDPNYWKTHIGDDSTFEKETEQYLRVNNLALEGLPADLVVNTHVCRGNYESCFAASGAYDPVAPILFAKENVSAFYLEYDDERSGSFEALKYVPKDKKVVLGLVTTKRPELEDKAAVIARIHEAARYVELDRLYLSPQCGFSSNAHGNKLTEAEQWAKVALVREIAQEVWKA